MLEVDSVVHGPLLISSEVGLRLKLESLALEH